jgi:surface protein
MSTRYRHFLKKNTNNNFIINVNTTNVGISANNQFQFTGAVGRYDVIATKLNAPNLGSVETFSNLINQQTITFANGSGIYELKVKPKGLNNTTRFRRIQFLGITTQSVGTQLLNTNNWTLNGNWQGNFTTGFFRSPLSGTHTLTNTIQAVAGNTYFLSISISGRTTGSIGFSFGDVTESGYMNNVTVSRSVTATNTNNLVITPTANFDGTITVSLRLGDANKITEIKQWGNVQWTSMERAFGFCRNMSITATDTPNLSQCTSLYNTFESCLFTNIGNPNWETGTITDMRALFRNCLNFNQDISYWETHNVTQITSGLVDGEGIFQNAREFNNGGVSLETSGNKWNMSNITDMRNVFRDAREFNQPIGNWNVSNVTSMSNMFRDARAFNRPLNDWDVSNVTRLDSMFFGAWVFNQDLNGWNTANVMRMDSMFREARAFNGRIDQWETHNVTTMDSMFRLGRSFNNGGFPLLTDGNKWNVSNVTTMQNMFLGTNTNPQPFNQDISNWNVSNVRTMNNMFNDCNLFNKNLNSWDVSNCLDFSGMFLRATSFNQPLNNWSLNTSGSVTINMNAMFDNSVFNQPLNNWNTIRVISMADMFRQGFFNQPLNDWNVSNVQNFSRMFAGNNAFNQPLNNWNTSSATTMLDMFNSAGTFNQNIGSWDVRNVLEFGGFLANKGSGSFSTSNLDAIYNGWVNLPAPFVKIHRFIDNGSLQYTSSGISSRNLLTRPSNTISISMVIDNGSGAIRVITSSNHGRSNGDKVIIQDVLGTVEANGLAIITFVGPTVFDINSSTFVNTYISRGIVRTGFEWIIFDGGQL